MRSMNFTIGHSPTILVRIFFSQASEAVANLRAVSPEYFITYSNFGASHSENQLGRLRKVVFC